MPLGSDGIKIQTKGIWADSPRAAMCCASEHPYSAAADLHGLALDSDV